MATMTALVRLGRDAELRTLNDGTPVANLALAYNYGKKENGKQPSQWVDATFFGPRAAKLAQYLTKGTAIVATLEDVHVRTFKKSDGSEGSALSGRVLTVEFAGKPSEAKPAARPAPKAEPARPAADAPFEDDDIPFN